MTTPLYILSAAPNQTSELKNFFSSAEGTVMELLRNPDELRYAGWDLQTLDTPRIVKGEYLQVQNGDRKRIRVYKDGTVIFVARADHTFLGWGRAEKEFLQKPRLNSVALVEVTYNFSRFVSDLLLHFTYPPESERFVVELKNTRIGNVSLYLNSGELDSLSLHFESDQHPAPGNNFQGVIDSVSFNEVKNKPVCVAYMLIEKIYAWFGFSTEKIPYVVKDDNGVPCVDVGKIKKLGQ